MNDQNQPKLSLEEELDVLEAVYKVGKEKGLELLRPEQMKRLRDAGRMGKKKNSQLVGFGRKADTKKITYYADFIVNGLLVDAEGEAKTFYEDRDWSSMSDETRKKAAFSFFIYDYGLSPVTMKNELIKNVLKQRLYE